MGYWKVQQPGLWVTGKCSSLVYGYWEVQQPGLCVLGSAAAWFKATGKHSSLVRAGYMLLNTKGF